MIVGMMKINTSYLKILTFDNDILLVSLRMIMPIYLLFLEFYLDYLSKAITCKAVGDQDGQSGAHSIGCCTIAIGSN